MVVATVLFPRTCDSPCMRLKQKANRCTAHESRVASASSLRRSVVTADESLRVWDISADDSVDAGEGKAVADPPSCGVE